MIDEGMSWEEAHSMLVSGQLLLESQTMFDKYIRDKISYNENFEQEVLATIPRAKYNLKISEITAFSAINSLFFLANPELNIILGGNTQLIEKTFEKAQVIQHLSDQVTELQMNEQGNILLTSSKSGKQVYDYVIIATPLESSHGESDKNIIKLTGIKRNPQLRKFIEEYVYVIEGKLSFNYFQRELKDLPNGIFITNNSTTE